MNLRLDQVSLVIVFVIWSSVRLFPILSYPGLYSYDAWNHLGYLIAIAAENRVPPVDPYWFPYYQHPGLHFFALIIHHFLGVSLITSLQIVCFLLIVASFLAFYVFLRCLLRTVWQVQMGLLILSLAPDFLAQTNAALPEWLGLSFLALAILSIIQIIRNHDHNFRYVPILCTVVPSLFLTHHLTTLIFVLACIAILAGVLLLRKRSTIWIDLGVTIIPAAFSFALLLFFDPFVSLLFERYAIQLLQFSIIIIVCLGIIALIGPQLFLLLARIQRVIRPRISFIIGFLFALAFFLILILFYPVERVVLWRVWKFGLLAILLGLAVTLLPIVPNPKVRGVIAGSFLLFWFLILCTTFVGSSVLAFLRPVWSGYLSPEASLAHRHFTYLTLVATPLACVVLSMVLIPKLHLSFTGKAGLQKAASLGIIGLFCIFLIGGSINVYFPAGGWHQQWFTKTEIDSAFWLSQYRGDISTTATDGRLESLFRGVAPYVPSNNTVIRFNATTLVNPLKLQGAGNGYCFISDLLESQFMMDFSLPPISVNCRSLFDSNSMMARIYDCGTVIIYHFNLS